MRKLNLQLFAEKVEGKIDRKYMAHMIDSGSLCHGDAEAGKSSEMIWKSTV